jgi:hypothetical protein
MKPPIYLAILNITSDIGVCPDAEHLYGKLILSENENINIHNVEDWNISFLGKKIEIQQPLTLKIAKKLDKKDGGNIHQRKYRYAKDNPEYGFTQRFDTFEEIVATGIAKWKELNLNCPFISLYEGKKYMANSYEPSTTVILQYGD